MKYYKSNINKKLSRKKRPQSTLRPLLEKRVLFVNCIKQIFKTAFITILIFMSIVSGYYLYHQAVTSPYFQISKIEIAGNHILQKSNVKQLVESAIGQNILRVNIPLIKNRLRENLWIEKVKVRRKFPDGLQVKIKERTPFAKIETSAGEKFLIDRNAFVIKKIENQEYEILPSIFFKNNIDYRIGSLLTTEEIKKGISFIEKILSLKNTDHSVSFNPFLREFISITVREKGRYILKTLSTDILLTEKGLIGNLEKLNIASRIIQEESLNVKFIDLRFNDQVVLKLL